MAWVDKPVRSPDIQGQGCGGSSSSWRARRFSGRATIYMRYDRVRRVYPFAVFVPGRSGPLQVLWCEVGATPDQIYSNRLTTPEAFDDVARSICNWTIHELDVHRGRAVGMESGLDWEEFSGLLDVDDRGEIQVHRDPVLQGSRGRF